MGKSRVNMQMEKVNQIRQNVQKKLQDVRVVCVRRKFETPLHKKLAKIERIYEGLKDQTLKKTRLFKMYKTTEKKIQSIERLAAIH